MEVVGQEKMTVQELRDAKAFIRQYNNPPFTNQQDTDRFRAILRSGSSIEDAIYSVTNYKPYNQG